MLKKIALFGIAFTLTTYLQAKDGEEQQFVVIESSLDVHKLDPVTNEISRIGELVLPDRKIKMSGLEDISVWPGFGLLINYYYGGPYVFRMADETLLNLNLSGRSFIAIDNLKILYYESDNWDLYITVYDLLTQQKERIYKLNSTNNYLFHKPIEIEDNKLLLVTDFVDDFEAKCAVLDLLEGEFSHFECSSFGLPRMDLGGNDLLFQKYEKFYLLPENGKLKRLRFLSRLGLPVFYDKFNKVMYMNHFWDTLFHGMTSELVAVNFETKKKTVIKKSMGASFIAPYSIEFEALINSPHVVK